MDHEPICEMVLKGDHEPMRNGFEGDHEPICEVV